MWAGNSSDPLFGPGDPWAVGHLEDRQPEGSTQTTVLDTPAGNTQYYTVATPRGEMGDLKVAAGALQCALDQDDLGMLVQAVELAKDSGMVRSVHKLLRTAENRMEALQDHELFQVGGEDDDVAEETLAYGRKENEPANKRRSPAREVATAGDGAGAHGKIPTPARAPLGRPPKGGSAGSSGGAGATGGNPAALPAEQPQWLETVLTGVETRIEQKLTSKIAALQLGQKKLADRQDVLEKAGAEQRKDFAGLKEEQAVIKSRLDKLEGDRPTKAEGEFQPAELLIKGICDYSRVHECGFFARVR